MTAAADVLQARLPRGAAVLEIGCGSQPARFVTIGLDCDHAAVRSAATRIPCVTGDAGSLPFSDRCFDAILARGVLHHLADPAIVLAEALGASVSALFLPQEDERPAGWRGAVTTPAEDNGRRGAE